MFETMSRQQFRRFFQPSRVVIGVIPAPTKSGVNVITLCFSMHCSYKPPMVAVAIHERSESYKLIQDTSEYVLAVPGASMAKDAMFCGTVSMRDADKVEQLNLRLVPSLRVSVPGLATALANIEMKLASVTKTGDHVVIAGEVLRFGVNKTNRELPLLSFGPNEQGFKLLERKGIHRLGTIAE